VNLSSGHLLKYVPICQSVRGSGVQLAVMVAVVVHNTCLGLTVHLVLKINGANRGNVCLLRGSNLIQLMVNGAHGRAIVSALVVVAEEFKDLFANAINQSMLKLLNHETHKLFFYLHFDYLTLTLDPNSVANTVLDIVFATVPVILKNVLRPQLISVKSNVWHLMGKHLTSMVCHRM